MTRSSATRGSRRSRTISSLAIAVIAAVGVASVGGGAFLAVTEGVLLADGSMDDIGVDVQPPRDDGEDVDARMSDTPAPDGQASADELLEEYEATVEANPTDHEALFRLADIEQLVGRPVESIAHLEKAIELAEEPSYYRSLAPMYASVGRWAESVEAWQNYLASAELDGVGRARVHAAIASAHEGAREYDKARESLEQALALDPGSVNYQSRLDAYGTG